MNTLFSYDNEEKEKEGDFTLEKPAGVWLFPSTTVFPIQHGTFESHLVSRMNQAQRANFLVNRSTVAPCGFGSG